MKRLLHQIIRIISMRNLLLLMIVASIAFSSPGCKILEKRKEKKRTELEKIEAEKRLRERIDQTQKELEDILNNENLTLEEKEKLLNDI